ncbi:hypothetical protein Tco_0773294 [Tanacetum coccineum]|uniref:Reverse transcriptase domain-containing protein n=1 Tax=Tanacetum coccineum TaxID=301880 RepID=A0ABQ4ZKB8_9ASTR
MVVQKLHQLDTFFNALNSMIKTSLNSDRRWPSSIWTKLRDNGQLRSYEANRIDALNWHRERILTRSPGFSDSVAYAKSSFDEPPEVELKDLPPHLEYAFLEGDDKLPVIIAKDLKDEEKAALIKVLKSHKRAIAWKLSDNSKVFDPEFCTHKIRMKRTTNQQFRVKDGISRIVKTLVLAVSNEFHNPLLHFGNPERISKKRTKNEAKTTKPDTEWKSVEKTQSSPSPSVEKSTQVNPDKPEAKSQEKQV